MTVDPTPIAPRPSLGKRGAFDGVAPRPDASGPPARRPPRRLLRTPNNQPRHSPQRWVGKVRPFRRELRNTALTRSRRLITCKLGGRTDRATDRTRAAAPGWCSPAAPADPASKSATTTHTAPATCQRPAARTRKTDPRERKPPPPERLATSITRLETRLSSRLALTTRPISPFESDPPVFAKQHHRVRRTTSTPEHHNLSTEAHRIDLLADDRVAPKARPRACHSHDLPWSREEILSDHVRAGHEPESASAHGSSSLGSSTTCSSSSVTVVGRPGRAGTPCG